MQQIREEYRQALHRLHYKTFTDVQKQVIPSALDGKDVFVHAPAGSGKTLAYVLPVLNSLVLQGKGKHMPKALILCPTRELCMQVASVIRNLLLHIEGYRTIVLTGGVDMKVQIRSSRNGADIVVGTPSRVLDHIHRHTLKPKSIETLVLDEADEMLQMGFIEDVQSIISALPDHQTLVLSATWQDNLKALCTSILKEPVNVHIEQETVIPLHRKVHLIQTDEGHKLNRCAQILEKAHRSTIIFTNRKATADFVCNNMQSKGFSCASIHSDMNWHARKKIMEDFRNGTVHVLCATAVAQRGIDIPGVDTVILYDIPDTQEQLIHRTARTGRADHPGDAWLLCTKKEIHRYPYKKLFPLLK